MKHKKYIKKIGQVGTSHYVLIPKWWMDRNRMEISSEVAMIVNEDYILIKSCEDPFLNDLTNPEERLLLQLSAQRQEKIKQVRLLVEKAMKELDEGKGVPQ